MSLVVADKTKFEEFSLAYSMEEVRDTISDIYFQSIEEPEWFTDDPEPDQSAAYVPTSLQVMLVVPEYVPEIRYQQTINGNNPDDYDEVMEELNRPDDFEDEFGQDNIRFRWSEMIDRNCGSRIYDEYIRSLMYETRHGLDVFHLSYFNDTDLQERFKKEFQMYNYETDNRKYEWVNSPIGQVW